MVEEKLQATIQDRSLGQVIVIQHQDQRRGRGQLLGQFIQQTVQPFFKGKWLVTLAHFQQAQGLPAQLRKILLQAGQQALEKTPGVAVPAAQPQPQALPVLRQALAKLHRQRTLAKPGRGANQ